MFEIQKLRESGTNSFYYNQDVSEYVERGMLCPVDRVFNLPDCKMIRSDWDERSFFPKVETSGTAETRHIKYLDVFEDVEGFALPPKNRFRVTLDIKSINKGRPSICDEIES